MSPVPSGQAEEARFLANDLRRTRPVSRSSRSRVARRLLERRARLEIELALPRAIAIAENYLLLSATRVIKPALLANAPPPNPPDADTQRLRQAAKSFPTLLSLWRKDLGVDLTSLAFWADFDELRDLRHILVHRLGAWQPGIDRPHPKLMTRIRRVAQNPDAYRGAVPVVPSDLDDAIQAVLGVIADADLRLP